MKITKKNLENIIKEELTRMVAENQMDDGRKKFIDPCAFKLSRGVESILNQVRNLLSEIQSSGHTPAGAEIASALSALENASRYFDQHFNDQR